MAHTQSVKKAATARVVRRSVSLSAEINKKVQVLAGRQKRSANRVLETLIEAGLEAKEAEKRRFFEVAERLRTSTDTSEIERSKKELARMIFGD